MRHPQFLESPSKRDRPMSCVKGFNPIALSALTQEKGKSKLVSWYSSSLNFKADNILVLNVNWLNEKQLFWTWTDNYRYT